MTELTRYDVCPIWGMEEDPEGQFVKYEDALKMMVEREDEIREEYWEDRRG